MSIYRLEHYCVCSIITTLLHFAARPHLQLAVMGVSKLESGTYFITNVGAKTAAKLASSNAGENVETASNNKSDKFKVALYCCLTRLLH